METLLLPFSPRFIVLTICGVVTGLLLGLGIVDRKVFDLVLPLEQVAEGYRAMDERRAIKTLLLPNGKR